jgi:thioredoxin 1
MHSLTLTPDNVGEIARALEGDRWIVACLCAAWCGTCGGYRTAFEAVAERHPDKVFVWIDIEDNADLLGDLDVENFPTVLVQREDMVAFFGTMLPELKLLDRLVLAQAELPAEELARLAGSSEERRAWQRDCNLRTLLNG